MHSTYNSALDHLSTRSLTWPRNSIHSTNCTLFSNGVSPFLANLSLPTDHCPSLDSRHLPSRSPLPERGPRSKRSFRSRQVTAASTKAFESLGEIEWPRLAVKFRFVDLISLLGMPRFLCLLSPPFPPSFFASDRPIWFPTSAARRGSCYTFFCCVNYRVARLFERGSLWLFLKRKKRLDYFQ